MPPLIAGVAALFAGGALAHPGSVGVLYLQGNADEGPEPDGFAVQVRAPLARSVDLAVDYSQLELDEGDGDTSLDVTARRWSVGFMAMLPSAHRPVAGILGAAYEHGEAEFTFTDPFGTESGKDNSDGWSVRGGVRLVGDAAIADLTYIHVECTDRDCEESDDSDTTLARLDLTLPVNARIAVAGRYDRFLEEDDDYAEWSVGVRYLWDHAGRRGPARPRGRRR